MLSDAQLAAMTKGERVELAHRLAAFNDELVVDPVAARKRRRRAINILMVTFLGLIPWIVVLGLTLPHRYVADHWEVAWVGYDVGLLCVIALTVWAAWKRRQVVILGALVTGTTLVIDAWFDLVTDSTTHDLVISIIIAVFGELPLAAFAFMVALRLIRHTTQVARSLAGDPSDVPLWRVPIFNIEPLGAEGGSRRADGLPADAGPPEVKES